MSHRQVLSFFAGSAAVALSLAACSSSGSTSSSSALAGSGGSGGSAGSSSIPAYNGPEAGLPASFPKPHPKKLVIGFLSPSAVVPTLKAVQDALTQEVHRLGGTVIAEDAQVNVNTQVSQFQQLLNRDVSAIVAFPLDPGALTAELAQAKAKGIPVVSVNQPYDASQPLTGYVADSKQGFDTQAYDRAKAVATASPGASYELIGFGGPAPSLTYFVQRTKYWADKDGLKYLGESDAQSNDASGGAAAMTALLGKYTSAKYVFVYDDPAALGAAGVVRSDGKSVRVVGDGGADEATLEAVKTGLLWGTFRQDTYSGGVNAADAAYDAVEKITIPGKKMAVFTGKFVTQTNVDGVKPTGPITP